MKNNRKIVLRAAIVVSTLVAGISVGGEDLERARDGSGVYGYRDTPILPWCGYHVHDPDRPAPKHIDSAAPAPAPAPSDAVVLFDGKDLSQWEPGEYRIVDGCLEAAGGAMFKTRESFGNCQIHLEWMAPANFKGPWYDQGNNGVMLMGLFEIQVFDSWTEKIYPDGQAAAVYGQTPPLVNATRKPGEWQTYDIAFTAPVFEDGKLSRPARVTLFHNGVLAQLEQEIYGETGHRILPAYKHAASKGPLGLAGHNCPVRFRNIWVRRL